MRKLVLPAVMALAAMTAYASAAVEYYAGTSEPVNGYAYSQSYAYHTSAAQNHTVPSGGSDTLSTRIWIQEPGAATIYDRTKVYNDWGFTLTGGGASHLTRSGCQNKGYETIYVDSPHGYSQLCDIQG